MKLKTAHKKFADEFLIDLNATRAYTQAYPRVKNANVAGACASRLLKNAKIQEYLQARYKTISDRLLTKAERIISETSALAFSNICEVVSIKGGRVSIKDTDKLPKEVQCAIESISETEHGIKVKMHSKITPLVKLGEREKVFSQPLIPEGNGAVVYLVPPFNGAVTLPVEGAEKHAGG